MHDERIASKRAPCSWGIVWNGRCVQENIYFTQTTTYFLCISGTFNVAFGRIHLKTWTLKYNVAI